MSEPLGSFNGSSLYLDTMIPYALLRGIEPDVRDLFQRIRQGSITAYTSVLTLDELAYRLLLALIKDRYEQPPLDILRKSEATIMAELYPVLLPKIAEFIAIPNFDRGRGLWRLECCCRVDGAVPVEAA